MQQKIFIVGFMGSGKSYWGQRLAQQLQWPFYDLDAVIEVAENVRITDLFDRVGESGFRQLEQNYLKDLIDLPANIVVATGGGAPCFFDNMAAMNAAGTTLYLKINPTELTTRLWPERANRPLLANLPAEDFAAFIEEKLATRSIFYEQARYIIERAGLPDDEFLAVLVAAVLPWGSTPKPL